MKKFIALLMVAILLPIAAFAQETTIPGRVKHSVPLKASYPDNPVIPGESSTTGLPFNDIYVPILCVIDNAEDAHPHWGISKADIMYQVPHMGRGATRLLALFADQVPEKAGGVRSGRAPFVSIARTYGAAFAYAGHTSADLGEKSSVPKNIKAANMQDKHYNLLGRLYNSRENYHADAGHNLSCHVLEIKNNLISKGVVFTPRPMLFTDSLPEKGVPAQEIAIKYPKDSSGVANPASSSSFKYDSDNNYYVRSNSSGPYVDLLTDEIVPFANVIIQRVAIGWQTGYLYLKNFGTSGAADIFTGGKYISGAWYRNGEDSRTIFVDENGNEIAMQRGKTFIVIANATVEVKYK